MVEASCGLPLILPVDLPDAYTWSWNPIGPTSTDTYTYNAEVQSNSTSDNYPMTFDVIRGSGPVTDPESHGYSLEPNVELVGGSPVYRFSSLSDEIFWFGVENIGVTLWLGRGCDDREREVIGEYVCITWTELSQLLTSFSIVE
jgi:hypothetical protein